MPEKNSPVISIHHLNKHYGGVHALIDVDLELYAGERLFIVGDNGAGKSTLVNVLSGIIQADIGSEIYFQQKLIQLKRPKDSLDLGIATVYQDLALCNNLNAYQNIFLGHEIDRNGRLNQPEMKYKTHELFENIGSNVPNPEAPAGTRSGGQRQAIAIARSLLSVPRVVLMDEPTAALGVIQRKQVSVLSRRLAEQGCAVLIVSQDLKEVIASADRVAVFRLGRLEAILKENDITHETIVAHITGAT